MAGSDQPGAVQREHARHLASARKRRAWSATNPGNAAIRAELVRAVEHLARAELAGATRILDVGCGTGWWLATLAADPRVRAGLYGVDLQPARVEAAAARAPAATIECADARALPYAPERFGVVTLFTVLSSLPARADRAAVLAEARRVLAPGGALLIWEPRIPNPLNRHTRLVSRGELSTALSGMELTSVPTTLLPPLARHLRPATQTLYPALNRIPLLRTHRLYRARATSPTHSTRVHDASAEAIK